MDDLINEKLQRINHINEVFTRNVNDDDGDKYLSQSSYAMEAIDAVLVGIDSPVLRQFMEAGA